LYSNTLYSKTLKDSGLEVVDWNWENIFGDIGEPNYIKIKGMVKNNGTKTLENVKIRISAYDADGNFLGMGQNYLNPSIIPPGSKASFKVRINDARCENDLRIEYKFEYE